MFSALENDECFDVEVLGRDQMLFVAATVAHDVRLKLIYLFLGDFYFIEFL